MALSIANIQFVDAKQYLTYIEWDETIDYSDLYEFALNSDGSTVVNRFGEMLIRINRPELGKYMYFVVTDNGGLSHDPSFSSFDVECSGYDLQWFIDTFFNLEYTNMEYVNDYNNEVDDDEKYNVDSECAVYDDDHDAYYEWEQRIAPDQCIDVPAGYETWSDWYDAMDSDDECSEIPSQSIDSVDTYAEKYTFSNDKTLIPGVTELNSNYSGRYFLVLDSSGKPVQTSTGEYLSRMHKSGENYRYYLTTATPELESDDRERLYKFYVFKSKYVGTGLLDALSYV